MTCRSFKVESHESAFIAVTSWVGSSFSVSTIEVLKYLPKALFSIFFELVFVVRSNNCNRCVMLFGTTTDSIPCFDKASDTLVIGCALKASHIRRLLNIWHKDLLNKTTVSFSLPQCFSLYNKQKPSSDSQTVKIILLLSLKPALEICFCPLASMVMLSVTTNVGGAWSAFMIN